MKAWEIIKRRAFMYLQDAKDDLKKGFYDLACFHAEQAVQLYLKAMILRMSGEERRGHEIRELLAEIAFSLDVEGLTEISERLKELAKKYRRELRELEEAYYYSRYKPVTCEEVEAEELVRAAEEIIRHLEEVEGKLWPSP